MEPVRIVTRTVENSAEQNRNQEPRTGSRQKLLIRESVGMELLRMISALIELIPLDLVGADCEIRWINCSIEQMSGKLSARESGKAKHNFPGSERGIWNFTLWPINDNNERETLNRSRTNRLYSGCEKHADLVPSNPINNATNPRNSHPKWEKCVNTNKNAARKTGQT